MAAVKKALDEAALVAGTLPTLSNLFFYFNIYDTNISYLETSGGQSSDLRLNDVHFFNSNVNWTSVTP
jgi:hypothetical protein